MPMRHRVEENLVQYDWLHGGRWNGLSICTGGQAQALVSGTEEEFIAEHYWGYSKQKGGGTIEYEVEHPPWRVAPALSATYDCDVEAIYGKAFVPYLREPTSAFVADGSSVFVRRGTRLWATA